MKHDKHDSPSPEPNSNRPTERLMKWDTVELLPPSKGASELSSAVLVMLAGASGLDEHLVNVANSVRVALDEQVDRFTRLDAVNAFNRHVGGIVSTHEEQVRVVEDLSRQLAPTLEGPRIQEVLMSRLAIQPRIDWDHLSTGMDGLLIDAATYRDRAAFRDQTLFPAIMNLADMQVSYIVHDTEDASAFIRLIRAALALVLDVGPGFSARGRIAHETLLLGLWAEVESRLPELPTRTGGPFELFADRQGSSGKWGDEGCIQTTVPELVEASRAARVQITRRLAGLEDIVEALARLEHPEKAPAPKPTFPPPLKRPTAESEAATIRERVTAEANKLTQAHLREASAMHPCVPRETLIRQVTHQVIVDVLPSISSKEDQLTIASYEALREPLPVAILPPIRELEAAIQCLYLEFPWATEALELITGEMLARRRLGALSFAWDPILLIGPPGTGKSHLARRVAEVFKLFFLPLGVGGLADSKIIMGTTRGWYSAEPSPLLRTMRDRRLAQMLVLLDEVDKCGYRHSINAAPMHAALLGLMEPETSQRWVDSYLQVPCDLSRLLYLATANGLESIDQALLSRMQVVMVPPPSRNHYPQIARQATRNLALKWGVPHEALPALDFEGMSYAVCSVRDLVKLVRRELIRKVNDSSGSH